MENKITPEMEMALAKCCVKYPEMMDVVIMLQKNDLRNQETNNRIITSVEKTVDTMTEMSNALTDMGHAIDYLGKKVAALEKRIEELENEGDETMEDEENIYSEMTYGDSTIKVLCDGRYNGIRFWIMNVRGSHPCGYIEVPKDHPYYNLTYQEGAELPVHGGVTFSEDHLSGVVEDTWILGWDYGHYGDKTLYFGGERHYVADIIDEIKEAINFLIEQ